MAGGCARPGSSLVQRRWPGGEMTAGGARTGGSVRRRQQGELGLAAAGRKKKKDSNT
jgi:hypothetical protein